MKVLTLAIITACILFVSCGITDSSKMDPVGFNDGLVDHIDKSEGYLLEIYDLDDADVSAEELETAAKKIITDLDKRIGELEKTEAGADGGEAFLKATINQLKSTKALVEAYLDFAEELSVSDDAWTDDMLDSWDLTINPLYEKYDITFEALETAQTSYASKQDFQVVD
jgi:hypothetical protein